MQRGYMGNDEIVRYKIYYDSREHTVKKEPLSLSLNIYPLISCWCLPRITLLYEEHFQNEEHFQI